MEMTTIQALYDFVGESEFEVSFSAGQHFTIVDDQDPDWYEVQIGRDMYGMVPKSYFEVVTLPLDPLSEAPRSRPSTTNTTATWTAPSQVEERQHLEAPMMYSFQAERGDEMSARAGDRMQLLAEQDGWYLVRRHSGNTTLQSKSLALREQESTKMMGLVPVAFVDTSRLGPVQLPSIPEWQQQQQPEQQPEQQPSQNMYHDIVSLRVPAYSKDTSDGLVWFEVKVRRRHGVEHVLYRSYDDFFAFQKTLLQLFPNEAGRHQGARHQGTRRILPYMPGPVTTVTDAITQQRRIDIDKYVQNLVSLPAYIFQDCYLVESFFQPQRIRDSQPDVSLRLRPITQEDYERAVEFEEMFRETTTGAAPQRSSEMRADRPVTVLTRKLSSNSSGGSGGSGDGIQSTHYATPYRTTTTSSRNGAAQGGGTSTAASSLMLVPNLSARSHHSMQAPHSPSVLTAAPLLPSTRSNTDTSLQSKQPHRGDRSKSEQPLDDYVKVKIYAADNKVFHYKVPQRVPFRSFIKKLRNNLPRPFTRVQVRGSDGDAVVITEEEEWRWLMESLDQSGGQGGQGEALVLHVQ